VYIIEGYERRAAIEGYERRVALKPDELKGVIKADVKAPKTTRKICVKN